MNSEALYIDLAEDPVITMALLADKTLHVEAFADKYAGLVREHYQARGRDRDYETAYREAALLHEYLVGRA